MRNLLKLIFIALFSTCSWSQDTLSVVGRHYQHSFITIANEEDTTIHAYRKDGSLESIRPINNGSYKRYYPSGNLLWTQERSDDKANGIMKFYTEKGKLIGTLKFINDSISDTLFTSSKHPFLFGRYTYTSVMHGGVQRADGSSNISRGEGPKVLAPLCLVKHEKNDSSIIYSSFSADYNGYFFSLIEKGSFGIFPESFDIESVSSTMGSPMQDHKMSSNSTWNIKEPLIFKNNFCYLSLIVHSIGYAP